jgi:hypothetical protein
MSSHRICCISVESVRISVFNACFSLFCSCWRFLRENTFLVFICLLFPRNFMGVFRGVGLTVL